tara:strand:+ start:1177 stop:1980 length:804 start_codon:yes stop_codon:yes gene_type:complete
MSDPTTPNSDVSRTVKIQCHAGDLASLLQSVSLDSPPSPVRVLLTEEGVSIWTHDNSKTIQALVTERKIGDLKVDEPCVLLIEPKAFADLLSAKFKQHSVRISTEAGKPITIKSRQGGTAIYHPADEDDCNLVPDHWVLPTVDGKKVFPMFDGEEATSVIKTSRSELQRALTDMTVSKAPYVVFSFSKGKSTSESGHWGSKTNRSASPIAADIEGDDVQVCFTSNLIQILKTLDGESITLHKHSKGQFVVLEGATTQVVATEAIQEV